MSDAAPKRPMQSLLSLQGLDTEIHQLLHRRANLPEAAAFEAATKHRAELASVRAALGEELSVLVGRQGELEERIAKQAARFHELERQMQAATGVAPRDLEAMDHELHQVAEHKSALEDEEIALLEEIEPIEAQVADHDAALVAADAELASIMAAGREAVSAIDAEVAAKRIERAALANDVPAEVLGAYDTVRARTGSIGAARLRSGSCDGCSLALSAVERDALAALDDDVISYCEHCSRILIRDRQLS